MLGDAIASKNVASCNLQQSGVEDDLGNEEEMVKGGGGATLGRLNGKQPYFLHFNLSPLLISLVIALILDLSLKWHSNFFDDY